MVAELAALSRAIPEGTNTIFKSPHRPLSHSKMEEKLQRRLAGSLKEAKTESGWGHMHPGPTKSKLRKKAPTRKPQQHLF